MDLPAAVIWRGGTVSDHLGRAIILLINFSFVFIVLVMVVVLVHRAPPLLFLFLLFLLRRPIFCASASSLHVLLSTCPNRFLPTCSFLSTSPLATVRHACVSSLSTDQTERHTQRDSVTAAFLLMNANFLLFSLLSRLKSTINGSEGRIMMKKGPFL